MDGFKALAADMVMDAKAAEAAAEAQDAFTLAWQAVAQDCHDCHAPTPVR